MPKLPATYLNKVKPGQIRKTVDLESELRARGIVDGWTPRSEGGKTPLPDMRRLLPVDEEGYLADGRMSEVDEVEQEQEETLLRVASLTGLESIEDDDFGELGSAQEEVESSIAGAVAEQEARDEEARVAAVGQAERAEQAEALSAEEMVRQRAEARRQLEERRVASAVAAEERAGEEHSRETRSGRQCRRSTALGSDFAVTARRGEKRRVSTGSKKSAAPKKPRLSLDVRVSSRIEFFWNGEVGWVLGTVKKVIARKNSRYRVRFDDDEVWIGVLSDENCRAPCM